MFYISIRIQAFLFMFYGIAGFTNGQSLPIKPERTVSFSTTEGSYMNIDVSPDGKYLLFDLLGDIHLVSSKGGKTRQLTHGIGIKSRPIWLTDGKTFSYLNDGSGELRRYKQSIIGKEIISLQFSDEPKNSISNLRSPNGRYRAYIRDTSGTRVLILYDSITDKKSILISSLLQKPYSYRADVPSTNFVFSPDSKSIYIGYAGKIHRVFVEGGKDIVIPFSADVKSDMGAFVYNQFPVSLDSFELRYVRSVNRRSDGKQLVFSALGKIYTTDISGDSPELLVEQDANQFHPTYSFDGEWIAYVTWNDQEGGHLWRVRATNSKPEQLTKIPGHYQRPAWSPDGKWIAVIRSKPTLNDRDDSGIGDLVLVPANGGEPKVLEDSVPLWNHLSFSADGKKVIFQPKFRANDNHQNVTLLVAKSIDGLGLEVFAEGPGNWNLKQMTISPDRKWLAYSACEDIYLLPVETGKTLQLSGNRPMAIKIGAGVDPVWESNGQKLSWTFANQFYTAEVEQIKNEEKNIKITHIKLAFKASSNYGKGIVAISGARIITMKGNEVIENGMILIKDGRIINLGKAEQIIIPDGSSIYDAKGKTIIPGFVDLHLHMRVSPDIFPQQSWMFLANFAYGVTTARDPSLSYDSFGYTELLQSGKMIGPRLYSVGRAARIGDGFVKLDNFEEAQAFARKRSDLGATVIKQYDLPNRRQRQWLLMACREAGLNMTNEGAFNPFTQMAMIKDGSTGIEHNPRWGDVYNDFIQLLAHSGFFLTPTIQVAYGTIPAKEYFKYKFWKIPDSKMKRFIKSVPFDTNPTDNGAESLENIINTIAKDTIDPLFLAPARINARMIKAGVKVCVGSHGNDQGIGIHNEIWALQMGGATNMQVLRAATLTGAEAIGIQKDLGSLEIGKIADLIILNSNPLIDIHNTRDIQFVMKEGILYEGNTLDEVWPKKKKGPALGR